MAWVLSDCGFAVQGAWGLGCGYLGRRLASWLERFRIQRETFRELPRGPNVISLMSDRSHSDIMLVLYLLGIGLSG